MIRSKYLIFIAAIVVALCLGASSALAEPLDQGPIVKDPGTANVYVPPADQFASPASPNPNDLSYPTSASTDGDSTPWLAIGLGAGGVVLLCGCAVGIQRTRRKRSVA